MTWYIADTRFRRVVLTWGDVDDNIEIRFVNDEYNVSEGMVSISPAAVVKGIGIDQYIEDRKSLIKIVREALHKKKKEKEDSKMNNKELISGNDLYDLVNTQYRRFLDEDHNNPLGHGITGDIRLERTSGNDDSKAFEEIKIILSKLNPNNCETIHLVKYRTSDHWRCCVDKLDNVFCKIYKDRVDREGYVCELFANPLVQYIISTVEEAIGPKETKEIAKDHDKEVLSDFCNTLKEFSEEYADSWLINKFNKLIGVLKTYCSEINQLDRHKRYYDTMSWDVSYMFNHNLLPPVTMTGDRYHYDYNPTSFKIFDMYDSNGDLMVNINHETFEINLFFYHSATEPFMTISANDYMGHIKHSYYDSHFHMDEFRFKYLIELIEKELKIQIMNPFADPITTWKTGFVPDKETLGKLCNYGATGKFESAKVHIEILTVLENFFRKNYKAEDICNDVYTVKCLCPERYELHLYNHGIRTKICAVYSNSGNNYTIFDSVGNDVCVIDAGIHKDIKLTRENTQKDLFWISTVVNLARQLCYTINDQPFINYLTHGYPHHIVRRIAKEAGIICDKEFGYKARREATSFERIKEHVMAWIHTYVETHPEEFAKEPSDNSLALPQITTTTKRHRGEKNTFEIEVVDNKDKIHRLYVVECVPGASYEIYNTGIYHSHASININIYEDGFGVSMPIGKIYDDFTREQMEKLNKYLGRAIKEDMVAILELETACNPCQLSNSNNQPMREVLDNSIDESSRIFDEMITTSLGIAKVSDYVTTITGINEEDIYMATDEKKEKYNKIPIKDVQFNSKKKTTTVIFGEKTDPDKKKKKGSEEDKNSEDIIVVSKCSPKDKFDPEVGLAMCIAKAYFGNRSKLEKAVAEWTKVSEARDKKKAEDEKKKKAKQKKNKSTTTTKKKIGTRPGRPRKKSLAKKDKETVIKETEILDNKPNEVKVDDNTDNIIG